MVCYGRYGGPKTLATIKRKNYGTPIVSPVTRNICDCSVNLALSLRSMASGKLRRITVEYTKNC